MIYRVRTVGITVEPHVPALGQMTVHEVGSRFCQPDHIRSEESGDDRHRHNNRIQEIARNLERHTQRSDDEGKLTDLCQAEAALHGHLQRLP